MVSRTCPYKFQFYTRNHSHKQYNVSLLDQVSNYDFHLGPPANIDSTSHNDQGGRLAHKQVPGTPPWQRGV